MLGGSKRVTRSKQFLRWAGTAGLVAVAAFAVVGAVSGDDGDGTEGKPSIPNGAHFPNPAGTSSTYSTTGSIDLTGPFFQNLGTNGRTCGSCHQPSDGMSVSADHVQDRFEATAGLDPIFRTVDKRKQSSWRRAGRRCGARGTASFPTIRLCCGKSLPAPSDANSYG